MIRVVDYGEGNVGSVLKALSFLGAEAELTQDPEEILSASHVIVPGQGAFKQAISQLKRLNLFDVIKQRLDNNKPFLGICLGFQILFEHSSEHGGEAGFGFFPGKVQRFEETGLKIPHMGWNSLKSNNSPLFVGLSDDPYVYFVHSYAVFQTDDACIASTTEYGQCFVSAVNKGNIWGTQFHPEKSSDVGLQILKNFISIKN